MSAPIAALRKQNGWFTAMADSLADVSSRPVRSTGTSRIVTMPWCKRLSSGRPIQLEQTAESYASVVRQVAEFTTDFHSEKGVH
jgi:hypothetical protein